MPELGIAKFYLPCGRFTILMLYSRYSVLQAGSMQLNQMNQQIHKSHIGLTLGRVMM
jgi:hypothetical protein